MNERCDVPNCNALKLPGKLMCLAHWKAVPMPLQLAVYRSWASFKRARKPNFQSAALRAYRKARDAAIASITDKQKGELSA